jgi:ligand-binding SRPBCC domain-containing protein
MKTYTFETEQWLPRPRGEVFAFFADARNLERLTPRWLRFELLTSGPLTLGIGAVIDYRLRLHGIPIAWQSEITVWEPPARFVDVQRRGPYRRWTHEHAFVERDGGTVVRDLVEYASPGGDLIQRLLVAPDLEKIFAYRQERLREIFGEDRAHPR